MIMDFKDFLNEKFYKFLVSHELKLIFSSFVFRFR